MVMENQPEAWYPDKRALSRKTAREESMRRAIEILEQLVGDGTLKAYAIGGGVAATFYAEPVLTYDLDAFVLLPPSSGLLVSLSPLYDKLRGMGFAEDQEHVLVGGLPVQFIPAYNALVEEAVENAVPLPFGDTTVRVVSPEHLLCIMLQTGRPKDRARAALFIEEAEVDRGRLMEILSRHGLVHRWTALTEGRPA